MRESSSTHRHTSRRLLSLGLGLIVATLVAAACDDDNPTPTPVPDLQNIWPNQDGAYWVYGMIGKSWVQSFTPYATPEMVPAAPMLDEVIALLQAPLTGILVNTRESIYRLQFDGMATTTTGAEGQNLAAFVDDQPVNPASVLAPHLGVTPGLLAQLWKARADLRPRLAAVAKASGFAPTTLDSFNVLPSTPTFLGGGVWEKGADWIGLYGDLDMDLAWEYLESDLTPGSEFTFQLVKSIADDVFLHARVTRRVTIRTSQAVYVDALEVVYLVDFGIAELTGPLGQTLGYTRPFSIGAVVYAPLAGPVWNDERALYHVGDAEPSNPLETLNLDLQERGRTR